MDVYMSVDTSCTVMEIVPRLDIRFGDMTLVFFDGENEVGFHDVVDDRRAFFRGDRSRTFAEVR